MGSNVFGIPVTDSTLRGLPEFENKKIRRQDRARVALDLKNAEQKDVNARTYVENLKRKWGDGVSTLCLIYNATGDSIRLRAFKDWYGHIGPDPYPVEIANGQWGAFLHVKQAGVPHGSVAAVVYRGKNNYGNECDWVLSWDNPYNKARFSNNVYTRIRDASQFHSLNWGQVGHDMTYTGIYDRHQWNGCLSSAIIGQHTFSTFEAVLTLT